MGRLSLFAAVAVAALMVALPAGAASHAKPCSTKKLHYTTGAGITVFDTQVKRLRATGTTCKAAQKVARTVAKWVLTSSSPPPRKIDGFKMRYTNSCQPCSAEDLHATGTHRGERVSFRVLYNKSGP